MEITREIFQVQRHRRFGTANPERMDIPLWEWMVRNELGPYRAMEQFGTWLETEKGPDWCFSYRNGVSSTRLADSRTIHIGGEYEDWYDEEFCIYNDIVLRWPDDRIEIYGYPRSLFPPTDFHTATLIDDQVFIVGCLGYVDDRVPGTTPVYRLDTGSLQIDSVPADGERPGWIYDHSAEYRATENVIAISGGFVVAEIEGQSRTLRNVDEFALHLDNCRWHRLTNHNWPQYRVRFRNASGKWCFFDSELGLDEALQDLDACRSNDDDQIELSVDGMPMTIWDGASELTLVVKSAEPPGQADTAVQQVLQLLQDRCRDECVLDRVI